MNDFIKFKLFPSLVRIWPWIRIPLIGFTTGIILYGFNIWGNPDMKRLYLDMATAREGTFWGIAGIVALIKILLIILMISAYWGFIFLFFMAASAYLPLFI
ncbi:MAG: hypothetical protein PHI70_04100 [Proteiniphilum sp.]|nr:hypothetical protein [Proteiniphilum sp.]MDD3908623.1 hypothetical protein [Proteiniphilum sp.]MDD4415950.1 hypothetical protein [Proteiniphilum sp.]